MDKNTYKILKFYNSHPKDRFSVSSIAKWFPDLSTRDLLEMVGYLRQNGYLRFCGDNLYQATNKGKTYRYVSRKNWLSKNIIAILALVVSILAFIESTISLIISSSNW